MTTSLSAQLQKLKVEQKDQISLPTRSKISFLFDIKKAANIDDQTLYYLCQQGISEIISAVPSMEDQLKNIHLTENSLSFYRGTKTKEQLVEIDSDMESLLLTLSPHLMLPASHKIVEYLIRIYEVHAHLKHSFIMMFLPYFETPYFLKAIQLVNLENDEYFAFMHQFAYQGEAISKKIIVKAFKRNNAIVFKKYSDWLLTSQQDNEQHEGFHHKFLGIMLVEMISENQDENLLYSVLPVLSHVMKSNYQELRQSGLMTIGQLCSQQSVSQQYAQAFLKQILMTIQSFESDLEIGIKVYLMIIQYQNIDQLSAQDVLILLKLPKILKTLANISAKFDLTRFVRAIIQTAIKENNQDVSMGVTKLICNKAIMGLKCTYNAVALLFKELQVKQDICVSLLNAIKSNDLQLFNSSILILFKQSEDKSAFKALLSLVSSEDILQNQGEESFSLLSAIGSQKKQVKKNGLISLSTKSTVMQLSMNEASLIELCLSQIIQRCQDEEEIMKLFIKALQCILEYRSDREQDAIVFDSLEEMLHKSIASSIYSNEINKTIVVLLVGLQTTSDIKQAVVGFCFKSNCPGNKFQFIIERSSLHQNIAGCYEFLEELVNSNRAYVKGENIIGLIAQVAKQGRHEEGAESINRILSSLKKSLLPPKQMESIVKQILQVLPEQLKLKCIRKIILITLKQKQLESSFDLVGIHNTIFEQYFSSQERLMCEFHIDTALKQESQSNSIKRVFSIQYLADRISNKLSLSQHLMLPIVLMLLNDNDEYVRSAAIQLAEAVANQPEGRLVQDIFSSTEKPKSTKKVNVKQGLTPIKPKRAAIFLNELLQVKSEIQQDRSQLTTFLNQSKHKEMLDILLRSLLDLPSFYIKTKLVKVLAVVDSHSLAFAITLADTLKRLFSLREVINKPKLGLDKGAENKTVILTQEAELMEGLGSLVNRLCSTSIDAKKQGVQSLALPFLTYILTDFLPSAASGDVQQLVIQRTEEMIKTIALESLFKADILSQLEPLDIERVLRCYFRMQKQISDIAIKNEIKSCLYEESKASIKHQPIQQIIESLSSKIQKKDVGNVDLELTLETIVSLEGAQSIHMLNSVITLLGELNKANCGQNQFSYSIELVSQIAQSIVENCNLSKSIEILRKMQDKPVEILLLCSNVLQETTIQILETKETDQNDPFNQFMNAVDTPNNESNEASQLIDRQLSLLQVTKSLSSLSLKLQFAASGNIQKQIYFLNSIASFIQQIQQHEDHLSMKYTEMTTKLFRFYQSEVIKSVARNNEKELLPIERSHIQDVLFTYVDTILKVCQDNENRQNFERWMLEVIEKAGVRDYAHLVLLLLLSNARGQLTLTQDFQIESSSLKFGRALLVFTIEQLKSIEIVQSVLMNTCCLPLCSSTLEFIDEQLTIMDPKLVSSALITRTWLSSKQLVGEGALARQLRYIVLYCIDKWLSEDSYLNNMLSEIAGTNPTQEVQDQFYTIYLILGIMKDEGTQYVNNKDYKKEKGSVDAKQSSKRLAMRVDALQETINKMLSHEIHSKIVFEIMQLEDVISLKTNSLQLLLQKTPDFHFQLAVERQESMVNLYEPLMTEAINFLQSESTKKEIQKSVETQRYGCALLALISKTACSNLSDQMQKSTLQLVLKYLESQEQYPLTVTAQIILTLTQLFEVYQASILEHLPRFVTQILICFGRSQNEQSSQEFFQESFTRAALKAVLSIVTLFPKFLNVNQLEQLITQCLVCPKLFANDVDAILAVVSQESPASIGLRPVFQAIFNCFDSVVVQDGAKSSKYDGILPLILIRFFSQLLEPVLKQITKQFSSEYQQKIGSFFKQAFNIPQLYFKHHNKCDISSLDAIEQVMVSSFQQFVVKLNEDQLGPIILSIVKWAQKSPKELYGSLKINMHRQIIMFKALSGTVEQLGEYAVPFLRLQIQNILATLGDTISIFKAQPLQSGKKRTKVESDFPILPELDDQHSLLKLLTEACLNLTLHFKHDAGAFIQSDIFEQLSEPIVAELVTLVSLGSHFLSFIEDSVKTLVFEMMERINNESLWIRMNIAILMKTRSEHPWQVRQASLQVVEHMFTKMGIRYLVVLNDTLPFISESLEDEHPAVEAVAKEIVKKIETLTGETIQEYLK